MNACGLGKMVPNMVLLGFKNDWMTDYENVSGYINVLHHALDMHLSVGVLKLKDGCDYSSAIGKEEAIAIPTNAENDEKKSDNVSDDVTDVEVITNAGNVVERQTSVSVYHDPDGKPLEKIVMDNIVQFQVRFDFCYIDVVFVASMSILSIKGLSMSILSMLI